MGSEEPLSHSHGFLSAKAHDKAQQPYIKYFKLHNKISYIQSNEYNCQVKMIH